MAFLDRLLQLFGITHRYSISRAIWIALAVLGILTTLFGVYYYWDRYVYIGNRVPTEIGIEQLEGAVQEAPQSPEMRLSLAEQYLNAGRYEDAAEQANQVLNVYPDSEVALLISGVAYTFLDQPEIAIEPLERFVAMREAGPMAQADMLLETGCYYLGQSYFRLARHEDAIRVLETALQISPVDADTLYQLGQAYQAIDQPQTALEHYHRAVTLVPDFAEVYGGMAESYATLDQSDYVTYAMGMSAFSRQDYGSAQAYLERATGALPDFAPAFVGLGLVYEQLGETEAALSAAERALELSPEDLTAQRLFERVRLNSEQNG